MTEMDHRGTRSERGGERVERKAAQGSSRTSSGEAPVASAAVGGTALPLGLARAQMLSIQRSAGNRAAQRLVPPVPIPVQRRPSLSSLKRAVGLGNKQSTPAGKAERAGVEARSAKIVTVADLQKQVSTLESATTKLIKGHQPGDGAGQRAALELQRAAERIRKNLPDQDSKASKLLGRTYPEQVRRLRWIVDETQLILDEVRVENTRREAQNIYLDAGRPDTKGKKGALENLTVRNVFDRAAAPPAPNPAVARYLKEHGFSSYENAFEDALAQTASDPRSSPEDHLRGLQPELFLHTERSRSRASAVSMGLSAAELAAIQTYSAQDYRYINPATANDPAWLAVNFPDLADKPDKSLEEWQELQDQLASAGQTLDQRMADRGTNLRTKREEGGLHTGVALQGLQKMPVWKGTAYRGECIDGKRFYPRFVKKGDGFAPRNPTFTWKTITSISKSEHAARSFAFMGSGQYRVIYEFKIINGRDIEGLSVNRREREIALLPGAEFEYGPIEVVKAGKHVEGFGEIPWELRITARQVK